MTHFHIKVPINTLLSFLLKQQSLHESMSIKSISATETNLENVKSSSVSPLAEEATPTSVILNTTSAPSLQVSNILNFVSFYFEMRKVHFYKIFYTICVAFVLQNIRVRASSSSSAFILKYGVIKDVELLMVLYDRV